MSIITDISKNSILRKKALRVVDIAAPATQRLIDQMLTQMQKAKGLGLAAPQIGKLAQICVFDITIQKAKSHTQNLAKSEPLICINPVITKASRELSMGEEGCLSLPKVFLPIVRAESVTVRYHDRHGHRQSITADDLFSAALQHEIDHLGGILMTDHYYQQTNLRKQFVPINNSLNSF